MVGAQTEAQYGARVRTDGRRSTGRRSGRTELNAAGEVGGGGLMWRRLCLRPEPTPCAPMLTGCAASYVSLCLPLSPKSARRLNVRVVFPCSTTPRSWPDCMARKARPTRCVSTQRSALAQRGRPQLAEDTIGSALIASVAIRLPQDRQRSVSAAGDRRRAALRRRFGAQGPRGPARRETGGGRVGGVLPAARPEGGRSRRAHQAREGRDIPVPAIPCAANQEPVRVGRSAGRGLVGAGDHGRVFGRPISTSGVVLVEMEPIGEPAAQLPYE